jgi:hypothetical protein
VALLAMRVELLDQPNALARIAAALGRLGANIVDVDVHELDGSSVADEMVIEAGPDVSPGEIRDELLRVGATAVLSVPLDRRRMDAVVRCLDAAVALARLGPDDDLATVVAQVAHVEEARMQPISELDHLDVDGFRLSGGIPIAYRRGDGESGRWVLVLPRPEAAPVSFEALVVERSGMRFSATEVARLRALLRVHAELAGARTC